MGLLIANIICLILIYVLKEKYEKIKAIDITPIMVFIFVWFITTIIEYLSHFIMDKCFGVMLWDYTKDFLNINKRVNWDASRNFAIGGVMLLYCIQPLVNKLLNQSKYSKKIIISIIILIFMFLDLLFHVILKVI